VHRLEPQERVCPEPAPRRSYHLAAATRAPEPAAGAQAQLHHHGRAGVHPGQQAVPAAAGVDAGAEMTSRRPHGSGRGGGGGGSGCRRRRRGRRCRWGRGHGGGRRGGRRGLIGLRRRHPQGRRGQLRGGRCVQGWEQGEERWETLVEEGKSPRRMTNGSRALSVDVATWTLIHLFCYGKNLPP